VKPPEPNTRPVEADLTEKVFRFGTELTYMVVLAFLWLVCSLPLVTIGAATVGAYTSITGHVAYGARAVVGPFFAGFKREFRRATLHWLVFAAVLGLFGFNAYYYLVARARGTWDLVFGGAQVLLAVAAATLATYVFAILGDRVAAGLAHPDPLAAGAQAATAVVRQALATMRATPGWVLLTVVATAGVPAVAVYLGLWQFAPFLIGVICYLNARIIVRSGHPRRDKAGRP